MKWSYQPPPVLTGGETRSRRVFAWKPTRIGQWVVWLEFYEVHERFFAPASGNPGRWTETSINTLEAWLG